MAPPTQVIGDMLDRHERIEPAGSVERVRSNLLHGVEHRPVRLR
ncbi:MAG: hypothetical protein R2707_14355 [Acidimicrobiales bacterium]